MRWIALSFVLLAGCNSRELKAVNVAAPQARYPVSLSEYIVVDQSIVTIENLDVVGAFRFKAECAKADSTADVSAAINDQVESSGGQGIIAFRTSVSATSTCQDLLFDGQIVKVRGTP